MKKFVRYIFSFIFCIVMLFGVSACNFVETNNALYYNQKVIFVGDHSFSRGELLNAFYNYQYQDYQSGNISLEEGVKSAATTMVNSYLLMEEIKSMDLGINIADFEKEIRYKAQTQMQSDVTKIEKEIMEERGLKLPDDESSSADEIYKPKVKYEDGQLVRMQYEDEFDNTMNVPAKFEHEKNNGKVSDEAFAKYVRNLQSLAKSEGRSLKQADVLKHEEKRLVDHFTNQTYLKAFEKQFLSTAEIDSDSVIEAFLENYKKQQLEFNRSTGVSSYNTAMESYNNSFVYYHPTESDGYALVSHILIGFNDQQKQLVNNYQTRAKSDPYYKEHGLQADIERVAADYDEESVFALGLFSEIKGEVGNPANDAVARMKKFQGYSQHNDDPGSKNADFYYAVNIDESVTNNWEKAFADAAQNMHNSGYTVGQVYDEIVVTAHGYHIMIYAGAHAKESANVYPGYADSDISRVFDENYLQNLTQNDYFELVRKLSGIKVNYTSEKTLFQYFYDLVDPDSNAYNNRINKLGEQVVGNATVVYKEYLYKDIWKNA